MVQYILLSDCALLSVTQASSVRTSRHAPPPTFTWPHLRCDVGLQEVEY